MKTHLDMDLESLLVWMWLFSWPRREGRLDEMNETLDSKSSNDNETKFLSWGPIDQGLLSDSAGCKC